MQRLMKSGAREVLARHDLIEPGEDLEVRILSGGISSIVLLAVTPRDRYVLKQPQPDFAAPEEWTVDTGRGKVEFDLGRFLGLHMGRRIVPVLAYDEPQDVLVMKAAPRGWKSWKERLLDGEVRSATGSAAGRTLAGIHALGADLDDPETFRHDALFRQQRIEPYFETAALEVHEAAEPLQEVAESFFARSDLVHGDFSPKNLLTDPAMDEVRLIDHEVGTRGDAAFDVGFFLTHLVMKMVFMPKHEEAIRRLAEEFLQTYQDARPDEASDPLLAREERAMRWLAACLVGRAAGKSRPEYLDGAGRAIICDLGVQMLVDPPRRLADALDRVAGIRH